MNPLLLEDLVCPRCDGFPLRLVDPVYDGAKVKSGAISCEQGHTFPIAAHVLDLVGRPREAEISDLYDELWAAHADQIYAGRRPEYAEKFRADTGLSGDLASVLAGAKVCDAGCGEGRYTFLASALGAKHVVAVDYSPGALERAVRGTGNPENCSFVRADLQELPFRPTFDYVFGFGTLHHTADTQRSFEHVAGLVRAGGLLSVYVYASGGLPRIYPIVRQITRRLPRERVRRFCDDWGFGYTGARRKDIRAVFRRLGRLDVLGLGHVTFEGLATPYIRGHTRIAVESWFRDAGFEIVASSDLVTVTGRRIEPAS